MMPLNAEPRAIATRMKVGMEAETCVRSVSGTLAMMRLLTKLQDIPYPMPITMESTPIAQRGPTGITKTRATVVMLIRIAPLRIKPGSKRSLAPEDTIAVTVHPKDSRAMM